MDAERDSCQSTKGERHGQRRSKRQSRVEETEKEKVKTIAAAPSQKGAAANRQPNFGSGKKK
jgi:hypothetical protein